MSAIASESVFLSALQPNTSVTTYGLPSEIQVGNGSTLADDRAKAQRVQQQVQMRLAQKATLPRQNEYGSSSTMKYQNCNPSYSARSQTITTMPSRMYNTTARSVGELGPSLRMSTARGGSRLYQHDDMQLGGFQGGTRQQMHVASFNMSRAEPDAISLHSLRQQPAPMNWMVDGSTMTLPPMRRSLSGTLSRGGGMEITQTHTFKGPAYRTINRINNRNRMSMGSMSGASTLQHQMSSGSSVYGGGARQGTLSRAMSVKSMHSVGKGMDIFDGSLGASMGNLSGINSLDMPTAVMYLRESDPNMQVLGAAYIQHECYNNSEAKDEVRRYKGISELVRLFNCDNQEVQRYATGATRNLIYENMDNKVALIEEGGIAQLIEALKENDDELHKNITGILWNLSSKDNLKEKLARETLPELTERILIPLASSGDSEAISQTPSEADIFYNTSGCLRNLSSVNEKTRQQMRETPGLVNALVNYIKDALENNKAEDKGVENAVCVLRNLSYQLYSEMPPSAMLRLEGPTRAQDTSKAEAIGCFTPQSRKAKNRKNQDLTTFTEVARVPKGVEWLWHPQIVGVYHRVLRQCEINSTTREAAAGALQNITAGDKRWASVLSRVALEQERMLPVLLDLLRHNNDLELRSLTGFFRNLSRHAVDKNDFATKSVNNLVTKLPSDGHQKEPSSDVVVNICGILNNLVTASSVAARDITFFDGLQKLLAIKNSHDNSPGKLKAAKAAATVLSNMFQYKKLHKDYKQKGLVRQDFADLTI
uniref:Plakophilin 3a n=1 Tax=Myripristis murdjan TaxID=586833 RepID=A0A668A7T1_9TELE